MVHCRGALFASPLVRMAAHHAGLKSAICCRAREVNAPRRRFGPWSFARSLECIKLTKIELLADRFIVSCVEVMDPIPAVVKHASMCHGHSQQCCYRCCRARLVFEAFRVLCSFASCCNPLAVELIVFSNRVLFEKKHWSVASLVHDCACLVHQAAAALQSTRMLLT